MHAIGVDIGGTSAKIGLIKDQKLIKEERILTGIDTDYDTFVNELCRRINALKADFSAEKIGISSCGLIDTKKGCIVYSNDIRWNNKRIAKDIADRTGLPVKIANDAKCAALAEAVLGAGRRYDRVCVITLGTGVGGCFIKNKKLDAGDAYADADNILGHITVMHNGRLCTCGRRGCLEAYASAPAVSKTYFEKTGRELSAKEIFEKAKQNDVFAAETVETFCEYLADGLTSLVNVLRPEIIVIGGGMSDSAEDFIEKLRKTVNASAFGGNFLPVKIEAAELKNQAGMIGAALL